MTARSRLGVVRAIVAKDLREFSRDRLWIVLTPIMLVAYAAIFWLLPDRTEEALRVGVYQRGLDPAIAALQGDAQEGLEIVSFATPEELEAAVRSAETVAIGIAFPDDLLAAIASGRSTTVRLYVDASVPGEITGAVRALVRELTFAVAGVGLPVTQPAQETIILGEDRVGNQVTLREQMRPLLVLLVLLVESMVLAGLVAVELEARTARAITVTPATVADLLVAKGVTGTILAFGQAVLLVAALASWGQEPLVLLVAILVASVMMAGVGMIAGAFGRDFITTLFMGIALVIPLAIPAFAALFPGTASAWVQALPTYGIVQALVGISSYGLGWSQVAGHLLAAAGWCAVLFALGWLILRRRVEAL